RKLSAGHRRPSPSPFDPNHPTLRESRYRCSSNDRSGVAGGGAMLAKAVESYVAVRRATGFAFKSQGQMIMSFAAFSDAKGSHHVSTETAIDWAGSAPSRLRRARRLGEVIRFARYIHAEDPRHEIP